MRMGSGVAATTAAIRREHVNGKSEIAEDCWPLSGAAAVAVLFNPDDASNVLVLRSAEEAARRMGKRTVLISDMYFDRDFVEELLGGAHRRVPIADLLAEVEQTIGIPVVSIVQLEDLIDLLEDSAEFGASLQPVLEYRRRYGVQHTSRA